MAGMDRWFWLERALTNLKALKGQSVNEEDTKRLIIEPLLAWIGYKVWEPGEVREQYPVPKKGGQSADYGLMRPGENVPYAIIEAKGLSKNPHGDLDQIIEYCNFTGARFGIITNGESWILLDEHWKGKPARERVVLEVKLEDDLDKRKGYEALLLLNPNNKVVLDDLCDSIKKLCESGVKNLEKHKKTEIVDALERIGIPAGEERPEVPQEHDLPESVQHWLIPVANTEEESAVECIKRLLEEGVFAIPPKRYLKPGDWAVFYAVRIGCVAKARVRTLLDKPPDGTGLSRDLRTIFELQDVEIFADNPVFPDEKLRRNLEAFRDKSPQAFRQWCWFVQGTRKITRGDFELLTSWKP